MDLPLLGLGIFGGWIALLVASDVFGILRVSAKKLTTVQSGILIVAIAASLGCGFLYAQERRAAPCAAGKHAAETLRHLTASDDMQKKRA